MTNRRILNYVIHIKKKRTQILNDPAVGLRKCLKCFESFLSMWVGNRICDRCKTHVDWDNESDYNVMD